MADTTLTPSKISAWLECGWYLSRKTGASSEPDYVGEPSALGEMLMEKGLEHEAACLTELERQGKRVLRVKPRRPDELFEDWAARVKSDLDSDYDVLYQFPLAYDGVRGIADFLVKTDQPTPGHCIWEPHDAKLSRQHAKPGHVLQLCFYAEALEATTGLAPRQIHLRLGSGRVESLTTEHFGAYWRRLRGQLKEILNDPPESPTPPEPCNYCDYCEFHGDCTRLWRGSDSLVYVAGIRKRDRVVLESAGVTTLAGLAELEVVPDEMLEERATRLQVQAALQKVSRDQGPPPAFKRITPGDEPAWGRGYDELAEPDEGDVFFDLEGHPFFTPAEGLFFLFGLCYKEKGAWVYDARWAHSLETQAKVAGEVLEFFEQRRLAYPSMHVYHYNHTERSSMAALSLGTEFEAMFTHQAATGMYVDLLPVARNSFQVGVESYGLKYLEKLTGYQRSGGIEQGAGAVVDYETYTSTKDQRLLDRIAAYNEDDVRATKALRDWLVDERPDDDSWRAPVFEEYEGDPELDALVAQLLEYDEDSVEHLLGDLLGYWRREQSASATPVFEKLATDTPSLLEDPDVIVGLKFLGTLDPPTARSAPRALFQFTSQEVSSDFASGSGVLLSGPLGEHGYASLAGVDPEAGTLSLVWTEKRSEAGFLPRSLALNDWVSPRPKPGVLAELAKGILANPQGRSVTHELLAGAAPRFLARSGPSGEKFSDELSDILGWVQDLDQSYVAIQGPPGTGKTYRGAHMIHALISSGKRVGIMALSHSAVDTLLSEAGKVFKEKGDSHLFTAVRKISAHVTAAGEPGVDYVTTNPKAADPNYSIVGGTTWLFASKEMRENPVDVLIIDEAGQLALADAVTASGAAMNMILLGDPQQLGQVSNAVHPGSSGDSVLEHVLKGAETIPSDRGVFLAETRRMHPDVCTFISEQIYEGRLTSYADCARQDTVAGTGLRWLESSHSGCVTSSSEEADIVVEKMRDLLGTNWTDASGKVRELRPDDFMVVAPYNDQVRLMRTALEESGLLDETPARKVVGTVDKFQGKEAPVVFFTMTTSTQDDMPRGPEFLFSRNRLNVAVSRARCLAMLVCTRSLLDSRAHDVEDMRLIGTLCAFVERAQEHLRAQECA